MKKALFIAYYYPPYGGGGVQRTTKYVKYLRRYGWEPVVLTIVEDKIPLIDESLSKDIPPNQEIIRTNIWDFERITSLLPRGKKAPAGDAGAVTAPEEQAAKGSDQLGAATDKAVPAKGRPVFGFIRRGIRKALRGIFLFGFTFAFFPDAQIGWYPFAVSKGKERIAEGDIDLIYTTSSPFTAHLIGLSLKKSSGKPWVMDLRDPWAGNKYLPFSRLRRPLDRLIEGICVHHADKVITVSEPLRAELAATYPPQYAGKFLVISNGYDEDDLQPHGLWPSPVAATAPLSDERRPMTFSYTGSFYSKRSPANFLGALTELLQERQLQVKDVRVQFTGQFGAESKELIAKFESDYPESIEVSSYVPHMEATMRMLEADILLLFLNKEARSGVLTGKIFEYLGSGKPVLAMVPQGLASELLLKAKAGMVVDPDDINGIKQGIMEYYRRWQSGTLRSTTDPEIVAQYSRKQLAGQLAQVFDALIGE